MTLQHSLAALMLLALGSSPALAQERVSIGTGGTGGVFYAVGAGMADILSRNLEGISANAEVTGASIENVRRVSAGEMTMGFSSSSTLYDGKNANDPFSEEQNVAAIAYLYPAALQIAATQKSGAKTLDDLADIRVSLGPPGSNSSVLAERLLSAYDAFNMGKVSFLSYNEATGAIKNGNLDASIILAGVPAAAFIELSTTEDITLISVDEDRITGLLEEYPYYETLVISAGTYIGTDTDTTMMGDPAILFTSADADPELIYQVTRTLFDNLDQLHAVHPAARKISLEKATSTPIALHPGAQRYFDEQ